MKASEARNKTVDELREELLNLRREQFNLRMQQGTGQLAKPAQVKVARRAIARIKTVLNEMAKAGNKA
ncbi:50S ribosomal protein L29 [Ectothiorhodospiraceae bacterium 2226]|nr:50S ribosomal protein L29 [Ectothiorhodospiraceae bacterium 2226]